MPIDRSTHIYYPFHYQIFVVDGSCDEDIFNIASEEFRNAVMDPELAGLPLLILVNSIDQSKARGVEEVGANNISNS